MLNAAVVRVSRTTFNGIFAAMVRVSRTAF